MPTRHVAHVALARLIVLAAISACHHQTRVHNPGDEYVAAIKLEGNTAIGTATLIDGLELNRRLDASRAVDDYQLAVDTRRILGAYQRRGYFGATVTPRVDRDGGAETVTFAIAEGPRATVHVEITGLPPDVPLATARALVAIREGAPFDYDAYDDAKQRLLLLVEDAGYAHARLEANVVAERERAVALARYVFDAGPACTFGPVEIVGVSGPLADAVRARIAFHEGERYSTRPLQRTQAAIYGLGRFATARVDTDRDSDATVIPVRIALAEANRHEARLGGGVGIDPLNYSLRGRAQYTIQGWPFAMSSTNVDFKPELTLLRSTCAAWYRFGTCDREPVARLLGTLIQNDFLHVPDLRGELTAGLDFLTIEAYRYAGLIGRAGLQAPLGSPRVIGRVGWLVGEYGFGRISPEIDAATQQKLGIDHDERIGELRQSIAVDLRDHPFDPHAGLYAELRAAEGFAAVGSAYRFLQLTPEVRGYVPLGPLVLAMRLRIGTIIGDVPPTERYYGGGASSDRGYPERQMSPAATVTGKTVVVGGAGMIESGVDLRIPVTEHWGTIAFLDGGTATFAASELAVRLMTWAVGTGVRYYIPGIGAARLDFAYRLGTEAAELPPLGRFQWFIGFNEAF